MQKRKLGRGNLEVSAIGLANMLVSAMQLQGLSKADGEARICIFDVNGLIEPSRNDLAPSQKVYAHPQAPTCDLVGAINTIKPTILIGVSTQGKAFSQGVIALISKLSKHPIVVALSNPTGKAECTAEECYKWSNGAALYAAGVQLPSVLRVAGNTFTPGQAHNFYIFPAVSLPA